MYVRPQKHIAYVLYVNQLSRFRVEVLEQQTPTTPHYGFILSFMYQKILQVKRVGMDNICRLFYYGLIYFTNYDILTFYKY